MISLSKETLRKKEAYNESVRSQIEQWHQEITLLEEETAVFSGDVRLDYLHVIASLRKYWQELRMNMEKLQSPDNEFWETSWFHSLEIAAAYRSAFQGIVRRALRDQEEGKIPPGWLQNFIVKDMVTTSIAAEERQLIEEL
jgi:hypothetical protein